MGKRQIRIFEEQIIEKLPTFLQREMNLILKNGVTLHGKIETFDNTKIKFKDSIHRKHFIPLMDIEEIVLDN
jgi:sRNA-binding regulator protein Hfq